MSISTDVSIPRLRADLRGQVIGPDDAGFDEARAVVAGGSIADRGSSSRSLARPMSSGS